MTLAHQPIVPLRLRARDSEETAAMEAVLAAFRAVRERQRRAGTPRVSQATMAAQDDVVVRMKDVFRDLLEAESQTAFLRLMQKAVGEVRDNSRCADCVWGLSVLLTTLCIAGGSDFAVNVDVDRMVAGGRIHSDFASVSRLVDSFCRELPVHFPRRDLAPDSPLMESVKLLRPLLTEETADAVTMAPGLGMRDLLDAVIRDESPEAIEVLRSGALIPEHEEEGRRLRLELKRLKAEEEHLASRENRTARWTMAPLASFGLARPTMLTSDRDFLDALLHIFHTFNAPDSRSTKDLPDLMIEVAHHPALLRWWLPRVFIPVDGIQFGAAHRRVIEALVSSPRRFLRLNSDPEAITYRRHLRPLIPLFDGYHPSVEQTALIEALRAPDSTLEHILDLLVLYLQARIESRTCIEVADCLMAGTECMLDQLAETIEGTLLVRQFAHLRNAEDVAFEKLVAEDAAAAGTEVEVVPPPAESLPAELEVSVPVALPEVTSVVFEMLENPGSARMRSVGLTTTRAKLVDKLSEFIEAEGANIEPPRSVARAIYHYLFEMPDTVRNTWNKESLNGFSWHKLKRGRCRIYIRTVGDTVCFCLINRRDWVHGDRIGRRF